MKASQAVSQIRNSVFKPGWEFTARTVSEYEISVALTIHTVDTSYTDAAGNFFKSLTTGDTDTINVEKLDEKGLCYALLCMAIRTDIHEDREFMKIRVPGGGWVSPLHPHTYAGELAWQRLGGQKGIPTDDLDEWSLTMLRMIEAERSEGSFAR